MYCEPYGNAHPGRDNQFAREVGCFELHGFDGRDGKICVAGILHHDLYLVLSACLDFTNLDLAGGNLNNPHGDGFHKPRDMNDLGIFLAVSREDCHCFIKFPCILECSVGDSQCGFFTGF